MNKKPSKVTEAASSYAAKKPTKAVSPAVTPEQMRPTRYVDRETASKLAKDILDKRRDLFRKLAQ